MEHMVMLGGSGQIVDRGGGGGGGGQWWCLEVELLVVEMVAQELNFQQHLEILIQPGPGGGGLGPGGKDQS